MAELARIRWVSSFPTSVDEELVGYDDGTALLVVRSSRDGSPAIGTWRTYIDADDRVAFAGGDLEIDLLHPPSSPIVAVAVRIAARARDEPISSATFYVAVVPGIGLALQAVGGGTSAAQFQLDEDSVIIHLENTDGHELAWHPADRLEAGFVSPTPEGLGGVGRPAEIAPGAYGTIALSCPALDDEIGSAGSVSPGIVSTGARQVRVEVAGQLRDALPQNAGLRRFVVRTAPVPYAN